MDAVELMRKEPSEQSLDTLFVLMYPARKQASQELFSRAAPTGFTQLSLLQKMPPSHQPKM